MCLSIKDKHMYLYLKILNMMIQINQQEYIYFIIYLCIDSTLEMLISFVLGTFSFPIISRLYVLMRWRAGERKDHQSRIECDEEKDREIDDCLVIRTCGRFRIYLRRIFFSSFLFVSSMFVTRRRKKRRKRH